jgi:hypothetical protein
MFGRTPVNAHFHSGYIPQRQMGPNSYLQPQNVSSAFYKVAGMPGYFPSNTPYSPAYPSGGWQPYQQPSTFYPNAIQQGQHFSNGMGQQAYSNPPLPNHQNDSQFLFQNPLQPQEDILHPHYQPQLNAYPNANPYPKQMGLSKPQGGGVQSIMNSFKGQDGSVDLNKMMDTAGQMMNAVNQVSSLVKGLGSMFKV